MVRIKSLCDSAYANTLAQQFDAEAECMVRSQETEEAREGMGAFLEKRRPGYARLRGQSG